jgi:hypothetical protein
MTWRSRAWLNGWIVLMIGPTAARDINVLRLILVEETSKPNASTIRELEKCAQDVHGGVGFGTELLIQFSLCLIPFSDREDDASGWVWGFLELLSNSIAWTGCSSGANEKRGGNETSSLRFRLSSDLK